MSLTLAMGPDTRAGRGLFGLAQRLALVAWCSGTCVASASPSEELPQVLAALPEKSVVRVFTSSQKEPVIGRLIEITAEEVRVNPTEFPVMSLAVAEIERVDASGTQSRATWAGLALGALAGGLVAAAMIHGSEDSESMTGLVGVVLVLPISIVIGGMMGNGVVDYHWQTRWERQRL